MRNSAYKPFLRKDKNKITKDVKDSKIVETGYVMFRKTDFYS